MLRYIEIADGRTGGLLEPAIVLLVFVLSFLLPRTTRDGRKLPFGLARFLILLYFPIYVSSLSLDSWGRIGSTLHFVARLAFGVAALRMGLLMALEIMLPRIQGRTMPRILIDLIHGFVYFFGSLWLLQGAGLDAVHLLTTTTVLGAIIGLSLQETLSNIFSGLAVQIQAPFKVGDWIKLEGEDYCGEVMEVNWRTTRICTDTLQQIDVPNAVIARNPIRNFNAPSASFEDSLLFTAPLSVSPFLVQDIAVKATLGLEHIETNRLPPVCGLVAFVEQGIQYRLRFFTSHRKYRRQIRSRLYLNLWQAFTERGLTPGFPIRQVIMAEGGLDALAHQDAMGMDPQTLECLHALASLSFLSPLGPAARRRLSKKLRSVEAKAGEWLYQAQDNNTTCYIVRAGALTLSNQENHPSLSVGIGDNVGAMEAVTGLSTGNQLQSETRSDLFLLSRSDLIHVLKGEPAAIILAIADRLCLEDEHTREIDGPKPSLEEILKGMV